MKIAVIVFVWVCGYSRGSEEGVAKEWGEELREDMRKTKEVKTSELCEFL